jgi:hypothetical protein
MAPKSAYTGAAFLFLLLLVSRAYGQGLDDNPTYPSCPATTETISQGIETSTSTVFVVTATIYNRVPKVYSPYAHEPPHQHIDLSFEEG